jgi:flagellar protein FlgJ
MDNFKLSSQSYHDFAGLGELKARAKNDDNGAAREVGQKFEAMFIQMMLKSVREANEPLKSDLMGSQAQDTFEEMYHQELAQEMSQRGVFGLAEWLTDAIQQQNGNIKAIDSYQKTSSMPIHSPVEQRAMPIEQPKRSFMTNAQDIK